MQSHYILALHGFLGSGKDWQAVESALSDRMTSSYTWIAPSLFANDSVISEGDLQSFDKVSKKLMSLLPENEKLIFIGYSLGARIGLHLLEKYSDHFKAFIFLSAHPGLLTEQEKQERQKNDSTWNEKLLHQSWSDFWMQWTLQPVFSGDKALARHVDEFNLQKLSCGLTTLSLAAQDNKEAVIARHQSQIIWAVGDQDTKFCAIAEDLKQKKILSGYERIFNSGHRVLFDQPSEVADLISSII